MTMRLPCPPGPGPLEAYAVRLDDLFGTLAQRRGFREYLAGLLLPRDRNKTLTCLASAEPVAGAQHAAVQRLRFFLSESTWSQEAVNARRLELLMADPATARTRTAGYWWSMTPATARTARPQRMEGENQDPSSPYRPAGPSHSGPSVAC
jgi:hypothetical protein